MNPHLVGFGGGGTVSILSIEIASFLGFQEMILIGTDVSYVVSDTVEQSGDKWINDVGERLTSTADDDPNHFSPAYFGAGKRWHNPNTTEMKIGFGRATRYLAKQGKRLINATPGGDLETVPRVKLESLFK